VAPAAGALAPVRTARARYEADSLTIRRTDRWSNERMGHESYSRDEKIDGSSDRTFGLVFAAFFGLLGLLPLILGRAPRIWAFGVSGIFLLAALLFPSRLAPLNLLWQRLGLLLHRLVSPIALGIMFFLVITPMGLLMRATGKDLLRLRRDPAATSYWIERRPPGPAPESLKDQF